MATSAMGCFMRSSAAGGVFVMESVDDAVEASKVALGFNEPRDEHPPVKVSEIS